MPLPFVIDNQQQRMAEALNELLAQSAGRPLDIATAYFATSGDRLVKETAPGGGRPWEMYFLQAQLQRLYTDGGTLQRRKSVASQGQYGDSATRAPAMRHLARAVLYLPPETE